MSVFLSLILNYSLHVSGNLWIFLNFYFIASETSKQLVLTAQVYRFARL